MTKLHLSVQYACEPSLLPSRHCFRRWVKSALERPAEIALRLVDEVEGRRLNRDYRGKNHATNVLSFAYAEEPVVQGDLVLCVPVVQREAEAQHKSLEAHFAHLTVHGMLHLQGWDHETGPAEAALMEKQEQDILGRLGYPDPYEAIDASRKSPELKRTAPRRR